MSPRRLPAMIAVLGTALISMSASAQLVEKRIHKLQGAEGSALYQMLKLPESAASSGNQKTFVTSNKTIGIHCLEDRYCVIGISLVNGNAAHGKGVVGKIIDPADAGRLYQALQVPAVNHGAYSQKHLILGDSTQIYCASHHSRWRGDVECTIVMPSTR